MCACDVKALRASFEVGDVLMIGPQIAAPDFDRNGTCRSCKSRWMSRKKSVYEIADTPEPTHAATYYISWHLVTIANAHHLCNSVKRSVPQAIERRRAMYEQRYPQKLGNHHDSTRGHRYDKKQGTAKFRSPTHLHPSKSCRPGLARIGMCPGFVHPMAACASIVVARCHVADGWRLQAVDGPWAARLLPRPWSRVALNRNLY